MGKEGGCENHSPSANDHLAKEHRGGMDTYRHGDIGVGVAVVTLCLFAQKLTTVISEERICPDLGVQEWTD